MNDVDFPVEKVLEGIGRGGRGGPRARQGQHGREARRERACGAADGAHFKGSGHIVRFIEFMDVGASNGWRMDDVVPSADIVRMIDAEAPLLPADPNTRRSRERWRYRDGTGEIGVISSVTQAFCRSCNRARCPRRGASTRACSRPRATTCASHFAEATTTRRSGSRRAHLERARRPVLRDPHRRDARLRKIEMSYIGG